MKDSFPPNNLVFRVMIIDPIQMIINTVVKTIPESFFDVIDRILDYLKHTNLRVSTSKMDPTNPNILTLLFYLHLHRVL